MFEFDTVSASSYDPSALASKLTQKSAEGWEVLSIVPTGGDVTAFVRREVGAVAATPDATDATVIAAVVTPEVTPEVEPELAPEVTPEVTPEVEPELVPEVAPVVLADPTNSIWSETTDDASATDTPEPAAIETPAATYTPEPTAIYTPQVDEPAGWGAVDEPTTDVARAPEPVVEAPVYDPAPTQQVPSVPAGWYADPAGRFELRYWDGGQWTEHVARGGAQYTDPPVA